LRGIKSINFKKVTDNIILHNINEVRTLSIAFQQFIHHRCASLTSRLKLLDLKIKEIKAVDKQIFKLKPGFVKKSVKKLKNKAVKMKKALKRQNALVKKVLRELRRKRSKILNILKVYDKKFHKKHNKELTAMMKTINRTLQPFMKYPYFKKAYEKFINFFLLRVKGFNTNHFKDPDSTARDFIKKHWLRYFNREKKKYIRKQANKKIGKKKKNKKYYN